MLRKPFEIQINVLTFCGFGAGLAAVILALLDFLGESAKKDDSKRLQMEKWIQISFDRAQ